MSTELAIKWVNMAMCYGRYDNRQAEYYYFQDERDIAGCMAIDALNGIKSNRVSDASSFVDMLKATLATYPTSCLEDGRSYLSTDALNHIIDSVFARWEGQL